MRSVFTEVLFFTVSELYLVARPSLRHYWLLEKEKKPSGDKSFLSLFWCVTQFQNITVMCFLFSFVLSKWIIDNLWLSKHYVLSGRVTQKCWLKEENSVFFICFIPLFNVNIMLCQIWMKITFVLGSWKLVYKMIKQKVSIYDVTPSINQNDVYVNYQYIFIPACECWQQRHTQKSTDIPWSSL